MPTDAHTEHQGAAAGTLAAALENEHHEIDAGIEAFLAARAAGGAQAQPLLGAISALKRHIFLEEQFLFPPLRQGGLFAPIIGMLRDHGQIWDTMDAVTLELADGAGPSDELCHTLLEQLDKHNQVEEAVVYPNADKTLTENASGGLRAFLDSGTMPAGWVCQKASAKPDEAK